jgi:hypothetical protein
MPIVYYYENESAIRVGSKILIHLALCSLDVRIVLGYLELYANPLTASGTDVKIDP